MFNILIRVFIIVILLCLTVRHINRYGGKFYKTSSKKQKVNYVLIVVFSAVVIVLNSVFLAYDLAGII